MRASMRSKSDALWELNELIRLVRQGEVREFSLNWTGKSVEVATKK